MMSNLIPWNAIAYSVFVLGTLMFICILMMQWFYHYVRLKKIDKKYKRKSKSVLGGIKNEREQK